MGGLKSGAVPESQVVCCEPRQAAGPDKVGSLELIASGDSPASAINEFRPLGSPSKVGFGRPEEWLTESRLETDSRSGFVVTRPG
jgi:hypothetical protein